MFISQDSLDDLDSGYADAKFCASLMKGDLTSCGNGLLLDLRLLLFCEKLFYGKAAGPHLGPDDGLAVSVLSDTVSLDI